MTNTILDYLNNKNRKHTLEHQRQALIENMKYATEIELEQIAIILLEEEWWEETKSMNYWQKNSR